MSMDQLTLWSEAAPAKASPSQERERALQALPDSCLSTYGRFLKSCLSSGSGKTFQVRSAARGGQTSSASCGRWLASGVLVESDTGSDGEFWTRSSSEWPSAADVSLLSGSLETSRDLAKYSLSPKACAGILRRAKKRGKPLPPMLDEALRAQGGGGVTAFAQNTRDEVRIQGDGTISGALSAQPGMKQQTYVVRTAQTGANGCGVSDEVAHTVDTTGPEAVVYGGCLTPWDVQSKRVFPENTVAPTLQAGTHEVQNIQPVVMASAHYNAEIGEGGVTPTLIAHIAKDAPVLAMDKTCSQASALLTETSSSSTTRALMEGVSSSVPFDDVTVIDRAAFNQGGAAAYAPHIEQTNVMDTLVARGPHAVGYSRATRER